MKTEFELTTQFFADKGYTVTIIGKSDRSGPAMVGFHRPDGITIGWIKDKDLHRFATNILKALHPVGKVDMKGANGRSYKKKK